MFDFSSTFYLQLFSKRFFSLKNISKIVWPVLAALSINGLNTSMRSQGMIRSTTVKKFIHDQRSEFRAKIMGALSLKPSETNQIQTQEGWKNISVTFQNVRYRQTGNDMSLTTWPAEGTIGEGTSKK